MPDAVGQTGSGGPGQGLGREEGGRLDEMRELDEETSALMGDQLGRALAALSNVAAGVPRVAPVEVVATPGVGEVDLTWFLDSGRTAVSVTYGRDGVDEDGRGPWAETVGPSVVGYRFDRLVSGVRYTFSVAVAWADGGRDEAVVSAVCRPDRA